MTSLVLLRHGESTWNAEGLFTGWVDVGLSGKGAAEAIAGGTLLRDSGLRPDAVHTSVLTRAIHTAHLSLEAAGLLWLPVTRSWRLNERHYGALQGKNKAQTWPPGGPPWSSRTATRCARWSSTWTGSGTRRSPSSTSRPASRSSMSWTPTSAR